MRFHIVGLPHTQATSAFAACALTQNVTKFARMMKPRGHEIVIYAGEETDAPCDELVTCFSEAERLEQLGGRHFSHADWSGKGPGWARFNERVAAELGKRVGKDDFVLITAGSVNRPIAEAQPDLTIVEFAVGYGGTFARYRVFQSYAWMHTVYGADARNASATDGRWLDDVIPGFIDADEFPVYDQREKYFLYLGRLIERKGYQIAADVCQELKRVLVVAGAGTPPTYGRYVGVVGPQVRARLMAGAAAVFMPTIYVEPFGNVAVEAMLSGTPVITTDWGAFTETVQHGVTGFRCRTIEEFKAAAEAAESLDRQAIRDYAMANFTFDAVAPRYERYFERLGKALGK